jgi:alpha/beta superfamily hydrolase
MQTPMSNEEKVRLSVGDLLLEGRLAHSAEAQRAVTTCVRLANADHFFLGQEEELAEHTARFASEG